MEFLEFKNLLFEKALQVGFSECEIYFSDGESISISVYNGEVEKYNLAGAAYWKKGGEPSSIWNMISNKLGVE